MKISKLLPIALAFTLCTTGAFAVDGSPNANTEYSLTVSDFLNIDKSLKVETVHELQSGTLKPTLNIKLFVPQYNKYVDYAMLSGGQALLADLKFLKGITQTLGSVSIMFLDEILKFFSADTVMDSIELLKEINVGKIFLILHGDYETNSNIINVRLDKDKGSVYS